MLFLNISTDQINLQIKNENIYLDRNEIENIIWPKIIQLHRKYNFTKILLINWPGGFTNLRVWTLAVNLLNSLENGTIDIYSITKVDLFKHFVDQDILPNKWIIYIWQKKNVWLYDFSKWYYETIKKEEIIYNDEIFVDLVFEKEYFQQKWIQLTLKDHYIILNHNWIDHKVEIDKLNITPQKIVEANYFIKPIMWKQWQ